MKADFHFVNHVRLIQRDHACTEAAARMTAWLEGPIGYHQRIGQMELPLNAPLHNQRLDPVDTHIQPEVKK